MLYQMGYGVNGPTDFGNVTLNTSQPHKKEVVYTEPMLETEELHTRASESH